LLIADLDDLIRGARYGINDDTGHGHLLLVGTRSAASDHAVHTRTMSAVEESWSCFGGTHEQSNQYAIDKAMQRGAELGAFDVAAAMIVTGSDAPHKEAVWSYRVCWHGSGTHKCRWDERASIGLRVR